MEPPRPAAETVFRIEPPLAVLTFNRPEARNALTWAMYEALVRACEDADRHEEVRVLVLRGAGGRVFAAGTDIAQFQAFRTPEDGVAYEQQLCDVLDRLERVTVATIAQIEGVAAGAGCVIAATCDLRVASTEATFGVPIARTLGNCLSGPAYSRLVEAIGPGRATEMLLTGRLISAAEALACGLAHRVVAPADVEAEVRQRALDVAANAPLTIRATKETARRLAARRRLAAADTRDLVNMCYASADFREGVSAFLAKRRPDWTGR